MSAGAIAASLHHDAVERHHDQAEVTWEKKHTHFYKDVTPATRTHAQGRNSKCECGSGLKYKRCCMK